MDWPSPTGCAGAPVERPGLVGGMAQPPSNGFAGGAHGFRWGSGVNFGGGAPDAMPPDAMPPLPKPPPPKALPPNMLLGVDMLWPENLQGGAELLDVDLPVAVYIDAVKERRRLHAGRLQFVRVGRHRRLGMRDDTAKQAEHVAHIGRLQLWKALQAPLEERVIGLHGPRPGPGRSGASQSGA